eukprot:gene15476-52338_t
MATKMTPQEAQRAGGGALSAVQPAGAPHAALKGVGKGGLPPAPSGVGKGLPAAAGKGKGPAQIPYLPALSKGKGKG